MVTYIIFFLIGLSCFLYYQSRSKLLSSYFYTNTTLLLKINLVLIAVLYILFLYVDFSNINLMVSSDIMKYTSIILCFFTSIITNRCALHIQDIFLLRLGLLATVFADLFLVILEYPTLGVIFFSIVQIIYSIRYDVIKTHSIIANYLYLFFIIIIAYLISNFFIEIDFLYAIALYYSIAIIISISKAIKAYKSNLYPSPNKYLILVGMILFLLCDVNVGIYNITKIINYSESFYDRLRNASNLLIWIFYLPSQVLLSLSGYNFNISLNIKTPQ